MGESTLRRGLIGTVLFAVIALCQPAISQTNSIALDNLEVFAEDVQLDLNFDSAMYTYTVIIDDGVTELDFIASATAGATISINGDNIQSTATVMLNDEPISIVVTASDNSDSVTYTLNIGRVSCGGATVDIDRDDDGLIEICDLEGLDAIRYQLDGSGYKTSADADTDAITEGCPASGCRGYELTRDLDFLDAQSYAAGSVKAQWTEAGATADSKGNRGWTPISRIEGSETLFTGVFDGNGHTISNLYIVKGQEPRDASNGLGVGLFAGIGRTGSSIINSAIRNIGLRDIDITSNRSLATSFNGMGGIVGYVLHPGNASIVTIVNGFATGQIESNDREYVGGLAGWIANGAKVSNSFANVVITATPSSTGGRIGGLVGNNLGTLSDVYAGGNINVNGGFVLQDIGGLIGTNSGTVENAYSYGGMTITGRATLLSIGGLIGGNSGTVSASYWDNTNNSRTSTAGGTGKTTAELQSPTAAGSDATEIYYGWSPDNWYFGSPTEYPILGYGKGADADDPACSPIESISELRNILVLQAPNCLSDVVAESESLSEDISAELLSAMSVGNFNRQKVRSVVPMMSVELSGLEVYLDDVQLNIDFESTTTYTVIIDDSVTELDFIARAAEGVVISINGTDARSATTVTITITLNNAPISIVATAEDNSSSATYTVNIGRISCGDPTMDIDKDGDGLIEICDLEGLDAIRHRLDGTGYKASADATVITEGCPVSGCRGYELTRDLNFSDAQSYAAGTVNAQWTTTTEATTDGRGNSGWTPISRIDMVDGTNYSEALFTGVFDGNGHTVSDLYIVKAEQPADGSNGLGVGLFAGIGASAGIVNSSLRNIGLSDIDITVNSSRNSNGGIGGIVGYTLPPDNMSTVTIVNSFTTGEIQANNSSRVGGLVGLITSGVKVDNSFSHVTINIDASTSIAIYGGLAGRNEGAISNVYASGNIIGEMQSGSRIGRLVGQSNVRGVGSITNAYAYGKIDIEVAGSLNNVGGVNAQGGGDNTINSYYDSSITSLRIGTVQGGVGQTTEALQSPTAATGIYENWSSDDWYFGSSTQYPMLGYGKGVDGEDPACSDIDDLGSSQPPPCLSDVIAQGNLGENVEVLRAALFGDVQGSVFVPPPAALSDLEVFAGNLKLDIDFSPTTYTYTVIIDDSVTELGFIARVAESLAISINGSGVQSAITATVVLDDEPINITVTTADNSSSATYTVNIGRVSCGESTVDIDRDDDGLIEICDLEGLDAIRHQLDGSGYRASADVTDAITEGCPPSGCRGFELTRNLSFLDAQSYADTANMAGWTEAGATADAKGNSGWTPISRIENGSEALFTGIFDGNGHTVSNLYMVKGDQPTNASNGLGAGLFAGIGASTGVVNSAIRNIGLPDINITNNQTTLYIISGDIDIMFGLGGIVGYTRHPGNMSTVTIVNSFVTGKIAATNRTFVGGLAGVINSSAKVDNSFSHVIIDMESTVFRPFGPIGALVSQNRGTLSNVYSGGDINLGAGGRFFVVGRLVGNKGSDAQISNTYAYGKINLGDDDTRAFASGGVNAQGGNDGVTNSYYDTTTDGTLFGSGHGGEGQTSKALQSPTAAIGIYANWSSDDWYFGSPAEYPILGYGQGADSEDPACSSLDSISDAMPGLQPPPCLSAVIASSDDALRRELLSSALFGPFQAQTTTIKLDIKMLLEGLIGGQ